MKIEFGPRNDFLFPASSSNPFGILGHGTCDTDLGGRYGFNRGVCYNEVECVLKVKVKLLSYDLFRYIPHLDISIKSKIMY